MSQEGQARKMKAVLPSGEVMEGELVSAEQMAAEQGEKARAQFEREQALVNHARELLEKNRIEFLRGFAKDKDLPEHQVAMLKAAMAEMDAVAKRIDMLTAELGSARNRLTSLTGQCDGLLMVMLVAKEMNLNKPAQDQVGSGKE